jgi:hypothetical protein
VGFPQRTRHPAGQTTGLTRTAQSDHARIPHAATVTQRSRRCSGKPVCSLYQRTHSGSSAFAADCLAGYGRAAMALSVAPATVPPTGPPDLWTISEEPAI